MMHGCGDTGGRAGLARGAAHPRRARAESPLARNRRGLFAAGLVAAGIGLPVAVAEPLQVVAAESVYGDIARQIGGASVIVVSILTNPNLDPHEFEVTAAAARALSGARLVIYNGADYDPWAKKLLAASPSSARAVIDVAGLAHKKAGDNPHLWYDPAAMSALGDAIAARLTALDPERGADYARGHSAFAAAMQELAGRIATLRARYAGTAVTATEPVFDYLADALGLSMRNARFQLAVMNGTEPSASAVAAFENDLRTHAVKALLYNPQTSQALAERMRTIAIAAGVPVVAVAETQPQGLHYQQWMLQQLDALDRALGGR